MATEYWFNTATGEVEEGRVSDWGVVLGPYPTREAAARALDTARRRSAAWDEADRAWRRGDDEPGDDEPEGCEPAGREPADDDRGDRVRNEDDTSGV